MKASEIMTKAVRSCTKEATLSEVGLIMVSGNCGIVPVVDAHYKVLGVVTDRDLLVNLVKHDAKPSEICVEKIMGTAIYTCRPDDSLESVLNLMGQRKVRRLPVTDENGILKGIISLDDIVLESHETSHTLEGGPSYDVVVGAFKEIFVHQAIFGTRNQV